MFILVELKAFDEQWVILDDGVYAVGEFIHQHPGGKSLIKTNIGTDITEKFNGGVYLHSNAARNLLEMMRVGNFKK